MLEAGGMLALGAGKEQAERGTRASCTRSKASLSHARVTLVWSSVPGDASLRRDHPARRNLRGAGTVNQ